MSKPSYVENTEEMKGQFSLTADVFGEKENRPKVLARQFIPFILAIKNNKYKTLLSSTEMKIIIIKDSIYYI